MEIKSLIPIALLIVSKSGIKTELTLNLLSFQIKSFSLPLTIIFTIMQILI